MTAIILIPKNYHATFERQKMPRALNADFSV